MSAGSRIALTQADAASHALLRARYGLSPARATTPDADRRLGYCGADYRVYPSMRIADAVRFYAALHARFDRAQLQADFALAGLGETFEVRRMKRAYQRALVLALACAAQPELLVVEFGDEFDEPGAGRLLVRAIARAPEAVVTFAGDVPAVPGDAAFTRVVSATSSMSSGADAARATA